MRFFYIGVFFVILLLNCNVLYFMFILVVLVNHCIYIICNTFRYLFFSVGKKWL